MTLTIKRRPQTRRKKVSDVEKFDVDERVAVAVRQYQYAIGGRTRPATGC